MYLEDIVNRIKSMYICESDLSDTNFKNLSKQMILKRLGIEYTYGNTISDIRKDSPIWMELYNDEDFNKYSKSLQDKIVKEIKASLKTRMVLLTKKIKEQIQVKVEQELATQMLHKLVRELVDETLESEEYKSTVDQLKIELAVKGYSYDSTN